MCRLAFFPEPVSSDHRIISLENYLVERRGGDGNGVGVALDGRVTVIKGLDKTPEKLFSVVRGSAHIFHTRKASRGEISNSNCHPFLVGNHAYAHNGTVPDDVFRRQRERLERTGVKLSNTDITDSEVLANYVERYDVDMKEISEIGLGVLLRLSQNGTAYVCVTDAGEFRGARLDNSNGCWLYASEFPENNEIYHSVKRFAGRTIAVLTSQGPRFIKGGLI